MCLFTMIYLCVCNLSYSFEYLMTISEAQESYNINDLLANEKQNFILVHAKVSDSFIITFLQFSKRLMNRASHENCHDI